METLQHKFVSSIPDQIDELTLYITVEYRTAIHKCVCGCGNEVITPFSPTDWELSFNGDFVSLSPSIGNWSFKCQSHYWIVKNEIIHASKWYKYEIDQNRKEDKKNKTKFYKDHNFDRNKLEEESIILEEFSKSFSYWEKFKKFFLKLV